MKNPSDYSIDLTKDLNDLFKRLKIGDVVKGRVLDKLDDYKYVVRIFGYNIITGSTSKLNLGAEVDLKVRKSDGHLIVELLQDSKPNTGDKKHLNIIA